MAINVAHSGGTFGLPPRFRDLPPDDFIGLPSFDRAQWSVTLDNLRRSFSGDNLIRFVTFCRYVPIWGSGPTGGSNDGNQ